MKKPIARILPFDNRHPDKDLLYPFPLPQGIRAIVTTDGTTTKVFCTTACQVDSNITGFAPHIEEAIAKLYEAMLSEPLPGITVNGTQMYFPGMVFDIIMHDREGSGSAKNTNIAYADWAIEDWPVSAKQTCAVILSCVPKAAFDKGTDTIDLWMRRSHVSRGLTRMGFANPYAEPRPILRPLTVAPDDWKFPMFGCAARTAKHGFWKQVDNCFQRDFKGCLIVDVVQPWSVSGNAFQLITEDDLI